MTKVQVVHSLQIARLPLHATDHHKGFAEVGLRVARWMRLWNEHLQAAQRRSSHAVLHDRVAARTGTFSDDVAIVI